MSMPPEDARDVPPPRGEVTIIYADNRAVHLAQGEPVFVLRGQDALAPNAIEAWARSLEAAERQAWTRLNFNRLGDFEPSYKVKEARAIAHDMWAWQERNFSKVPD